MKRQYKARAENHTQVTETKLDSIGRKQRPYLHSQGVSGILDISQHCRHDHYSQTDPEEDEEPFEVTIIAVGVEVGQSRLVFDRVKGSMSSFLSC